ncbi:hypothetical protein F5141DRAFT_1185438 [Pisolithus sp. B1]|nr:hypothetical protein F5141DRAFT_1185438 [Pisolithus sp. B1]
MTELAAVRAQIKAWERDFRSARDRDPSIQDIKDQPHIADKYKLYKKLSKSATTTTTCPTPSASQNPSTPRTRSSPSRTSATIPKSRKAEAVAPLPGFNPFSPVKNKGKERDTLQVSRPSNNPFTTPTRDRPTRTRSPDPFPSIVHTDMNTSPHDQPTNLAVSRARKRLRGEPVSPSPNKQKRQRFRSSDRSDSDDDPDVVAGASDLNAPFIGDSPVKAPAGGKSFKLLFDDTLPVLSVPKKVNESAHFPHSKPTTLGAHSACDSRDPFTQGISERGRPDDIKSTSTASISARRIKKAFSLTSSQIRDNDASAERTECKFPPKANNLELKVHHQIAQAKSTVKRTSMENESTSSTRTPTYYLTGPGKLKGGFGASRKKPRVELQPGDGDDSDEDGGSGNITVKVIAEGHSRLLRHNVDDLDCDPLLNLHAQGHDPITAAHSDANRHEFGTFNVDLPDKLRHVLAISPSRDRNRREERVVRGLLYGDRVDHYDPSRGGEIWDAGEWDDGVRDPDAEDDWEGEPVPWEVGEL